MNWADAYLAQAKSDLAVYEHLGNQPYPACHRLHYLQMWLEKLCKSLMLPEELTLLQYKHGVVAKVLPRQIQQRLGRTPSNMRDLRRLCREIDLLHPQVDDDGKTPANVEYPFLQSGSISVPADWNFDVSRALYTSHGRTLLSIAKQLSSG
jgi:hypothetical protein